MQALAEQLRGEKSAFDELQHYSAIEIRSLQAAAQQNFEAERAKVSQAWEQVRADREQLLEQKAELQRLGAEYQMRDQLEGNRVQKLLEKEKDSLEAQWAKLKEHQKENRQQQLLLENRLVDMETSQQKLDALDRQRNMQGSLIRCRRGTALTRRRFLQDKLRDLENERLAMDKEKSELELQVRCPTCIGRVSDRCEVRRSECVDV